MGYSHYWYTKPSIPDKIFSSILHDVKRIQKPLFDIGVPLSGPDGTGDPILDNDEISFNGVNECGHSIKDIFLTWPSKNAYGISVDKIQHVFPNTQIDARTCNGSCMYDSFIFKKHNRCTTRELNEDRLINFNSCKTAFRPYDIAVMAVLIIAKHYLINDIQISSDGDITKWRDTILIVYHFLEYGNDFELDE